jgi:hypothetical protein
MQGEKEGELGSPFRPDHDPGATILVVVRSSFGTTHDAIESRPARPDPAARGGTGSEPLRESGRELHRPATEPPCTSGLGSGGIEAKTFIEWVLPTHWQPLPTRSPSPRH